MGGYAKAAAPTAVSADGDAVNAWHLLNGAQATVLTAAGALIGGDATNGLQVDVTRLPALVAGSAAIGKLAANSGVDIGDVDILSIAAGDNNIGNVDIVSGVITTVSALGISTTGPQKAEDVAHVTGDMGIYALAVRDDALAAHSGTDGDYESLHTDANGALWTSQVVKATGGCKAYSTTDLQETEVEVTTGPTTIYGIYALNATAGILWLKMFNTNTVTPGTTAPLHDIPIPANADSDGAGFTLPVPPQGWAFSTALSIHGSSTRGTTAADVGAAGSCSLLILYQD